MWKSRVGISGGGGPSSDVSVRGDGEEEEERRHQPKILSLVADDMRWGMCESATVFVRVGVRSIATLYVSSLSFCQSPNLLFISNEN